MLTHNSLVKICDLIVYVDVPAPLCLARRLRREKELNVKDSYTLDNYETKIYPAQEKHILANKYKANIVLQNVKYASLNPVGIISRINSELGLKYNSLSMFTRNRYIPGTFFKVDDVIDQVKKYKMLFR